MISPWLQRVAFHKFDLCRYASLQFLRDVCEDMQKTQPNRDPNDTFSIEQLMGENSRLLSMSVVGLYHKLNPVYP